MEVSHIFRNIPELLALGLKVAKQLEKAAQNLQTDRSLIGNVFLDHVEEWNVYIKYVENFSRAKKTIRKLEEHPGPVGEAFTEALKVWQVSLSMKSRAPSRSI
ncbi:hypothetical protein HK097_010710 [Rhizophlyctis rosea]|uniref:DH domain-containing protein n=1 Tax=Rhizophlyctis rosea TaxID=64517 RepID=A0AAD5SI09_9FUNG|nr:hypothetical protein HK097_010710 [Rhizophlyctis rosea]